MRILLVHPEDSPLRGPWAAQRWDLVVDLGRSSVSSVHEWQERLCCPVLRSDSFRCGIEDLRQVRNLFSAGRGYLLDEEGIDWWDLASLVVAPEAESLIVLQRMVAEVKATNEPEVWATRTGWSSKVTAMLLGVQLRAFGNNGLARSTSWVLHYARLLQRFRAAQIKEIFLDKYDSQYQFRSRFASRQEKRTEPVVLVPSAYGNVSRMAAAYARLLPEQSFLLVTTRKNASQFTPPSNIHIRNIAAYTDALPPLVETSSILERWRLLQQKLSAGREFEVLASAGVFQHFARWFRDGLIARNAWRQVLAREPVKGVLCGDDSNIYTRVPVLLAAKRKIPTVDFHHGALDGRYLLKDLPCDVYLAKNEMERDYLVRVCSLPAEQIVIASPAADEACATRSADGRRETAVVLFSEPYEVAGMRPEEVYRELLPALCRIARENGRSVIVKLHPFESRAQRQKLVRDVLSLEDRELVTVMDGPLTSALMQRAWFGITVESTTAMDCLQSGVRCFLCGWLSMSSYEYPRQYARFGVGEVLSDLAQIAEIPPRLRELQNRRMLPLNLSRVANPALLRRWLTSRVTDNARSVS
ncbi:MAG: hypothetical protein WCB05_07750 [Candidatus Sulfotelmatobacter sp.]